MILGGLFDLDSLRVKLGNLTNSMNDSDFWSDSNRANDIVKKISSLKGIINVNDTLHENISSYRDMISILDDDIELYNMLLSEYDKLFKKVAELKIQTFLNDKYDKNNCILELHAGAGGTESCDWVLMLYRMYSRYLKKNGYKVIELDSQKGDEVGYKSVMLKVEGMNAYGYLKNETGIHRLVRISPFDSNKRRHTSFASVEITPDIDKDIDILINDKDIKIDIFRSSGPGGQGVNTTDSAVRVTYLPLNIVVTCQNERSQIQNKEHCMEVLKSKLYKIEEEKKNKEISSMKNSDVINGFGSAKRSYVMCPYTRVIDNDSKYETSDVEGVLDGKIDNFIIEGLKNK